MNQISNKEIIGFLDMVDTKTEFYASDSDKEYLRNYDACDDYVLSKIIIKKTWDKLHEYFSALQSATQDFTPVTVFHTNAGTGKVLSDCPSDNILITAFNNDYACKRISDILNQRHRLDYSYESIISDVSHYFIGGDNGNNRKFDIVFTQPINTRYYKDIDDTNVASLDFLEYYPVRSLDFLTKGGYLCIFTHPRKFNILKNNITLKKHCEVAAELNNPSKFEDYGCLILKKK